MLNIVIVTTVVITGIINSINLLSTSYMPRTGPIHSHEISFHHQSNPTRQGLTSHLTNKETEA